MRQARRKLLVLSAPKAACRQTAGFLLRVGPSGAPRRKARA
jgi:hypothetical protein